MSHIRFLICLALGTLLTLPTQAALIWQADFSSYDTSGGAVTVTTNATGDDDTFNGVSSTTGTGLTFASVVTSSTAIPALTGNALKLSLTNTSGASGFSNNTMMVSQYSQASLGGSGILILSYDVYAGNAFYNRSYADTTGGARSGSANTTSATFPANTLERYTFVINQTGSTITLGDGVTTLANNMAASYLYDGTTYFGFYTTTATSTSLSGFDTGTFKTNSIVNNGTISVYIDNMGMWNSLTDTAGGTSVLSLAPGMALVPEPSTTALFILAGTAMLVLRRRAQSII